MFPVLQGTVSSTRLGTFAKPAIRKLRLDLAEGFSSYGNSWEFVLLGLQTLLQSTTLLYTHTERFKPPLFSQSMTVQLDVTENIILLSATFLSIF